MHRTSRPPGRESPRRVGLVGAGNIAKLHLAGIERHPDRVRVAALCDPDADTCRQRAGEHGVAATYRDVRTMIRGESLDAAIVCTPTHIRRQVISPLLEGGVPVLCEKPFAETLREASELAAASRTSGVPIAVNQNFRRHFTFHLARDVLRDGSLGRPLHLTQVSRNLRRDTGWRLQRSRYVMAVMSIHWFDGYRWLLGGKSPKP